MLTRRTFLATAACATAATLHAQSAQPDVAAYERPRLLEDAKAALAAQPTGFRPLSNTLATLTAAYLLTKEPPLAERAGQHLIAMSATAMPENVTLDDLVPIAEAAVALRFLVDALPASSLDAINDWLAALQTLLNTDRSMLIARDLHNHRASAWLLLSAAIARSQRDTKALDAARARFRKPTLRNQIRADGTFPEELATPNPYRNTLYNYDLLCAACQLLASPFDLLWDYELPDGPGMRSVSAFLVPVIRDRNKWPAISDAEHFRDLPGRRAGLLFAGRAYGREEYIDLWRSFPPTVPAGLEATFPVREPLLWVSRPLHGL